MAYREIRELALDEAFLAALRRFVAPLADSTRWTEFYKIPRVPLEGTGGRRARDLAKIELLGNPGFLGSSSAHGTSRALSLARLGVDAARVFELLCLNYAVDERDLAFAYTAADLDAFVAERVLMRHGSAVMMTTSLIPYGGRYYVADTWHLKERPEEYQTHGAPIGYDTWLQIEYVRRRLRGRKIDRLLEIGPGLGIVLSELREFAAHREGAEYDARTLTFARANLALWDEREVEVFQSDLLGNAKGLYDLVMFNPWQPSEEHLDLILRFIDDAAGRLTDAGAISLLLNTPQDGVDPVMAALSDALSKHHLAAERDIVHTFSTRRADGAPSLRSQHFSWITRAPLGSRAGANITDTHSLPWLALQARQLLGGLRK